MTEIPPERQLVTRLLKEWGGGNKEALDELMPIVYQQLRKRASICLRSERPDHTQTLAILRGRKPPSDKRSS